LVWKEWRDSSSKGAREVKVTIMSNERLQLLRKRLVEIGWNVSVSDGAEFFRLYDNRIRWRIEDQKGNHRELKIFAAAGLGGPANLRDILYCEIIESGRKMYFGKLNSKKWQEDLDSFLSELK
jgi:hypothetical protein